MIFFISVWLSVLDFYKDNKKTVQSFLYFPQKGYLWKNAHFTNHEKITLYPCDGGLRQRKRPG